MSMFTNASGLDFNDCTFTVHSQVQPSVALEKLANAASPSAFHSYVGRPDPSRCYPNTRVSVLDGLKTWGMGLESPDLPIKWLNGGAGAGKSAVAQSFSELCEDEGLIVASFFFFRADPTRNRADRLVASLAHQIARADVSARGTMDSLIQNDPHIFSQDIQKQISSLVIHPLLTARQTKTPAEEPRPCVVIIDGLDECIDGGAAQAGIVRDISNALRAVGPQMREILPRFIISSRPEEPIAQAFRSPALHGMFAEVQLVADSDAEEDIQTYFKGKFDDIKATHPRKDLLPMEWPSSTELSILRYKSSGHFIYPRVVVSVVSADARPAIVLQSILGLRTSPQRIRDPFAELDELFRFILSRAAERFPLHIIQRLLGFLALSESPARYYHPDVLGEFFDLEEGDMDTFLSTVASLVIIEASEAPIFFLRPTPGPVLTHKSFSDFLFNESRSGRFFARDRSTREYIWTRSCNTIAQALECECECPHQEDGSEPAGIHNLALDCLQKCINGSTIGLELQAALSKVRLTHIANFWSRHHPSNNGACDLKFVFCIKYCFDLLRATRPQAEQHLAGLLLQAIADIVSIVREFLTSEEYNYLIPALLLSRVPSREDEDVFPRHPMRLLSLISMTPQYCDQPISRAFTLLSLFSLTNFKGHMSLVGMILSLPEVGDPYCLTTERYTFATYWWIQTVANCSIFWDPCRNLTFPYHCPRPVTMINELQRRYKTPCRWRLAMKATKPFGRQGRRRFVRSFAPVVMRSTDVAGDLVFSESYRRFTFRFILSRIPAMLERASKSDALAAMRFKSLAPLVVRFPEHAQKVRIAMEAYAAKHGYST